MEFLREDTSLCRKTLALSNDTKIVPVAFIVWEKNGLQAEQYKPLYFHAFLNPFFGKTLGSKLMILASLERASVFLQSDVSSMS